MSKQQALPIEQAAAIRKKSRAILIALLFPTMAIILNGAMFGVALPTIRDEFGLTADIAAWLTIAFSLPFMMLMPLYGRLSDDLGKSRLLIAGILLFCVGSVMSLSTQSFVLLFVGRMIQGAGSAGITPLSLAIITERFSAKERGRALGTWNSVAPGTSIFAPSIGGFLVDSVGWRTIFIPAIVVGIVAVFITRKQVPTLRGKPNWSVLKTFDWGGMFLLGGTIVSLVFYFSSRPVTGVEPLQDWRLLLSTLVFGVGFTFWERRHLHPLVDLTILRSSGFRIASISASLRMAMMIGIGFLLPLYLADIYGLNASAIGLMATVHSISLFIFIRLGGSFADRWSNRWLITVGLGIQMSVMGYFALLPADLSLLWIVAGAMIHGLGGGLSLAALHRTALNGIPPEQTGVAAGVYSMIRFAGWMLATVLAGVILQNGLERGLLTVEAYQIVFSFLAVLGLGGVLLAFRLREK